MPREDPAAPLVVVRVAVERVEIAGIAAKNVKLTFFPVFLRVPGIYRNYGLNGLFFLIMNLPGLQKTKNKK